jgi:ribosomal protein L3 glutamine methyltransferase
VGDYTQGILIFHLSKVKCCFNHKNIGKTMSELTDLHTIRDMVRWAVSRFNEAGLFYGHGSDTAWDEAVTLVLRSLHLPHDINPTVLDARLTSTERVHLQRLIHRRVQDRVPVAYLIHESWFAGLPYYVDERVLIPRSPIAEMIENEFHPWLQIESENVHNILDYAQAAPALRSLVRKLFQMRKWMPVIFPVMH